jgi:hypothetical protein
MGATIDKIKAGLARYPRLRYQVRSGPLGLSLRVEPPAPTGFAVELHELPGEFVVYFDGWHEHFAREAEALDCFALGLSDRCRLRVTRRGDVAHHWVLEYRGRGGWVADSEVGLLLFPFWRTPSVVYLQNDVLKTGEA